MMGLLSAWQKRMTLTAHTFRGSYRSRDVYFYTKHTPKDPRNPVRLCGDDIKMKDRRSHIKDGHRNRGGHMKDGHRISHSNHQLAL